MKSTLIVHKRGEVGGLPPAEFSQMTPVASCGRVYVLWNGTIKSKRQWQEIKKLANESLKRFQR